LASRSLSPASSHDICRPARGQAQSLRNSVHLLQNHDLECAIASEHVYSHVAFIVSGEQKINSRISYSQIANAYLRKEGRQNRFRKYQRLFGGRHAQAKASFEQKEDRRRGPRLRSAGHRIKRRRFTRTPWKAAKEFRQTMQIEEKSSIEQTCENHRRRVLQSVSG